MDFGLKSWNPLVNFESLEMFVFNGAITLAQSSTLNYLMVKHRHKEALNM